MSFTPGSTRMARNTIIGVSATGKEAQSLSRPTASRASIVLTHFSQRPQFRPPPILCQQTRSPRSNVGWVAILLTLSIRVASHPS